MSAELQQTVESVAADSQLKMQSVSAVDHTGAYPVTLAKDRCSVCPRISCTKLSAELQRLAQLQQRVSSFATNSQLS